MAGRVAGNHHQRARTIAAGIHQRDLRAAGVAAGVAVAVAEIAAAIQTPIGSPRIYRHCYSQSHCCCWSRRRLKAPPRHWARIQRSVHLPLLPGLSRRTERTTPVPIRTAAEGLCFGFVAVRFHQTHRCQREPEPEPRIPRVLRKSLQSLRQMDCPHGWGDSRIHRRRYRIQTWRVLLTASLWLVLRLASSPFRMRSRMQCDPIRPDPIL